MINERMRADSWRLERVLISSGVDLVYTLTDARLNSIQSRHATRFALHHFECVMTASILRRISVEAHSSVLAHATEERPRGQPSIVGQSFAGASMGRGGSVSDSDSMVMCFCDNRACYNNSGQR